METKETRLKNVRRRHNKKNLVKVLYSDEGCLYEDDRLTKQVSQEVLDNYLTDERITLVVVAYENMNPDIYSQV